MVPKKDKGYSHCDCSMLPDDMTWDDIDDVIINGLVPDCPYGSLKELIKTEFIESN